MTSLLRYSLTLTVNGVEITIAPGTKSGAIELIVGFKKRGAGQQFWFSR